MRKRKWIFWMLVLSFGFLLESCSDDDDNQNVNVTPSQVTQIAKQGTWRIAYFFDESDKTNQFDGYNFTFGDSNHVQAVLADTVVEGTWFADNDDDDGDVDFNLLFIDPVLFQELNDDWDIMELTNTRIRLVDVSGGDGGTDYLTFERN